ncbi:hypothetical protein [Pseudogemmobacter faecipullorum]|uniref:Uncharacterized protein n=1 Tax=Pseudogemmobacter faecipullorum TaxID=2755041 RepID=A0ABS8CRZ9_9RHOB|nr:hypothetical protein [Pseudogemmobacter faecipullorum]MCB5412171.1 hypothetical protein [Pseudogemmobacter faecipullorum]
MAGFAFGLYAGIVGTLFLALWMAGADLVEAVTPAATLGAAIAAACSAWISSKAARHSEAVSLESERSNLLQQITTASLAAERKSQRAGRLYQKTVPFAYHLFPGNALEEHISYYQGLENDVDAYRFLSVKMADTRNDVLSAHDAHTMGLARREFTSKIASILTVDSLHENRRRNAVQHQVIPKMNVEEDLDPLKVII